MLSVDVSADDAWGDEAAWTDIAHKAMQSAAALTGYAAFDADVSLLLTDDEQVQQLNKQWRGKDRPTNVLSFPMLDTGALALASAPAAPAAGERQHSEMMLGDIALAYETCAAEADDKRITLQRHVTHLIIHGALHLLGYDHIVDSDAETMERLEIKALASLGLPNPYVANEHEQ